MTIASARQPFLSFDSFSLAEREAPAPASFAPTLPARSPFLSVYESGGEPEVDTAAREAFAALVDELHDDEFDASMAAVQNHARAFHDQQMSAGMAREPAERLLMQHMEPLLRETGAMVDSFAQRFAPQAAAGVVEQEFEDFVAGYAPEQSLEPVFENWLFKALRKVGKIAKAVAKQAVKGVAMLGWGAIWRLIKKHLMGFLTRGVQVVMGKLPPALQPAARMLAAKLGFKLAAPQPATPSTLDAGPTTGPTTEPAGAEPGSTDPMAGADITANSAADTAGAPALPAPAGDSAVTQQELDEALAGTLLAADEAQLELEFAEAGMAATRPAPAVFAELDDARERFIREIEALKEGESPQPALENFLPMMAPVFRIAAKLLGGRDALVRKVAQLLTPLIARFTGPAPAAALSQAIVGAGATMLGLEAPENEAAPGYEAAPASAAPESAEAPSSAATALAATVEETMARIAALPAEMHEDPQLFEAFALEAFEAAAASNLPALFSAATYRQRPELLEGGMNITWPLMPLAFGPRRYKRCSARFTVTITPYMAGEIESFEGAPLADHLEDELGLGEAVEAGEVDAEVTLYEALPGTTLGDIARGERETLGPDQSDEANVAQLHPLTPQAASVLLGKPGLGRAWRPSSRHRPLVGGQRFYALRLTGPNQQRQRHGQRHRRLRPLHLRMTLDALRDEVRVCLYYSEARAQQLAIALRQKTDAGMLAARFDRRLARRLWHLLFGNARHRLRIVDAALPPGPGAAVRAQHLPPAPTRAFAARLRAWLTKAFVDAVQTQRDAILAAIEDPREGVTLRFTVRQPPGLKALTQAVANPGPAGPAAPALAETIAKAAAPQVQFSVVAGHGCA